MSRNTPTGAENIYNGYRMLLALLLLGLSLGARFGYIPHQNLPRSFLLICVIYLPLAMVIPMLMTRLKLLGFIIDIIVIILLIHNSGGIAGSLAVLMMVIVASANIVLQIRLGLLLAAIATLSILGEQILTSFHHAPEVSFTAVGLLGFAFFVISLLIQQVSQRLERSEALSEKQRQAIVQLEAINHQVVSRMRTGIIVFDETLQVVTANPAAQLLFDAPLTQHPLPAILASTFRDWQANAYTHQPSLKLTEQMPAVRAGFANLDENAEDNSLTIVFLEDEARVAQEAQHLKLASLGRMSAIIAHEIRNPLSAIQHATDLLAETSENRETAPLFNIVHKHVSRVNSIINSILDLSRRPQGKSEQLLITDQAQKAIEHLQEQGRDCSRIHANAIDATLAIHFTENQLQQILHNLIGNALHHGGDNVRVTISAGTHSRSKLPWLRISDDGKGITPDAREHLFEPFYTTDHKGTGLGLFLCSELCQANQAQLELETADDGTSFMITFAHPDRFFQ